MSAACSCPCTGDNFKVARPVHLWFPWISHSDVGWLNSLFWPESKKYGRLESHFFSWLSIYTCTYVYKHIYIYIYMCICICIEMKCLPQVPQGAFYNATARFAPRGTWDHRPFLPTRLLEGVMEMGGGTTDFAIWKRVYSHTIYFAMENHHL